MNIYISFGDEKYAKSLKILEKTAYVHGAGKVVIYTFEDLKQTDFYRENQFILSQSKGCGYWLWKPYIILDMLQKMNDDDCLIYTDAALEVIGNLKPLYDLIRQREQLLVFAGGYCPNKVYTKPEAFHLMGCDEIKYLDGMHVWAGVIGIRKNDFNLQFIKEWLSFCKNYQIISDEGNRQDCSDFFVEHRHDQSVLSLLVAKYNLEIFCDPSQYGNELRNRWWNRMFGGRNKLIYKNSSYPQLFNLYRRDWVSISKKMRKYAGINVKRVNVFLRYLIRFLTCLLPSHNLRQKLRKIYK